MNVRLIEIVTPVREVAAHPDTIRAVGLDRLELVDELSLIRMGIAFGTPLIEDPSVPLNEVHGRGRSATGLTRRPMTIRKTK